MHSTPCRFRRSIKTKPAFHPSLKIPSSGCCGVRKTRKAKLKNKHENAKDQDKEELRFCVLPFPSSQRDSRRRSWHFAELLFWSLVCHIVAVMRLTTTSAFFIALGSVLLPTAAAADMQPHEQLDSRQEAEPLQFEGGTSKGCYSSKGGDMTLFGQHNYQSSSYCGSNCTHLGMDSPVLALQGYNCYCGDLLPSPNSKLPLSACSITCPGWSAEPCMSFSPLDPTSFANLPINTS